MSAPSAALRAKAAVNYAESSDSDSDRDGRAAAAPAKRVRKASEREAPAAPRPRRVSLPPPTDAATAAREAGLQPGAAATRLLEITLNHPDTVDAAVSDWADAYEARRAAATAELLSLLVQAAGADASVAAADVDEGDTDDLVARLVAAVTAGGVADPYARGGRAGARARAAYGALWRGAIGALAARGLLGDGYFVDKATAVLLGLSSSIVRPFRLLATQTAGDVGTALVTAALSLGAAREAATAQREAELAKGDATNRDTVAQLQRQADDAHRAAGDARAALDALYTGIATARFRDVCPDVRAAVVAAVGAWIQLDPAAYLSEHYLKYVAWAMSDRDARVRAKAVDALRALYADPALHSALRSFTERFTSRFVELVHDVDDGVAGKGVDLVGALVRAGELPADDAGDVFRLLTEPAPAVRAAAADLVAGLLASEVEKKAAEGGGAVASPAAAGRRGRRGRAADAATASTVASQPADTSTLAVDALLDVLARLAAPPAPRGGADEDDEDAPAPPATTTSTAPLPATTVDVVVASLADRVPVLTDFAALVAALSEDAAEARGEPGTTNAVLLLAAAVKAAAGQETGKRRRGAGARSTSPLAAATAALAPVLAPLLTRFGADAAKVAPLVATLAWLDLAPLAATRDGGGLAALLRKVADLAARHADAGAVRACARALARCAESGPGSARGAARDVLDGAFVAAAAAVGGGGGGGRGRGRGAAASAPTAPAWRRAASLCLVAAPPQNASESIVESAQRVLGTAATGADVETEIVASASAAGLACLLWRLTDAANASTSVTSPARTRAAAAVGGAAGDYAAALADAVSGARDAGGRAAAAASLADLLLAFSAKGLAATPAAAAAAYDAPPAVAQALLRYCDAAIAGADAAAPAPGAPDKTPAEAAALMLARLLAYGVVGPASDAAYVLLSHVAADDAGAAAAARDGVRSAQKIDAAPSVETWAKALGAAAGRGADALDALVGAVLVAPSGSPLDVGGDKAAAVVSRAVDAAFATPGRLSALAPLAGLATKVRPADAAVAAAKVRAAADRAARLAGVGVGAESALHAVADALSRRATAAGGGGAVRPALRAAGAAATGNRDRRISFAGDEDDGLAASDEDGGGLTASDGDDGGAAAAAAPPTRVQLGGSSADRLPTHPVAAAADDDDDDESENEEDVRRAPARV